MKQKERLKQIEKDIFLGKKFLGSDETVWLISRIKRLTEALEFYKDHELIDMEDCLFESKEVEFDPDFGKWFPFGHYAKRALEDDE